MKKVQEYVIRLLQVEVLISKCKVMVTHKTYITLRSYLQNLPLTLST
ncbi:hypothetical protein J2Y60_002306 [Arcicella sp. BE140]|nr:hypothetical protein [Arcicella sp. BE51]MDR6812107.1 hypothetical protein [Arcicella sp. BE140]MDR6823418.1 hypothetical protein [Arcicella sp. BE139]